MHEIRIAQLILILNISRVSVSSRFLEFMHSKRLRFGCASHDICRPRPVTHVSRILQLKSRSSTNIKFATSSLRITMGEFFNKSKNIVRVRRMHLSHECLSRGLNALWSWPARRNKLSHPIIAKGWRCERPITHGLGIRWGTLLFLLFRKSMKYFNLFL